jgi:predicted GIY-YIG superfamily endonuclease
MAAGQLWLFPPPRPLVERLGADFFRELPERPGVYLMCGREEGVLYVGSAKNLRRRLTSYRVANPERLSRRIVRLLHRVTRIEIDECSCDAAARAREELLICVLSPRFNRAGKVWPMQDSQRHGSAGLRSGAAFHVRPPNHIGSETGAPAEPSRQSLR